MFERILGPKYSEAVLMKLKDISKIIEGLNSQRLRDASRDSVVYTANDLNHDLSMGYHGNYVFSDKGIVNAGDVVFHLMSATSAVVSMVNDGKLTSQNILKFQFDRNVYDPWYLCYVLNEAQSIKHQLHNMKEGTVSKLITPTTIRNLCVKFPDINTQQQIGFIYSQMLVVNRKKQQYLQKQNEAILGILRKKDSNE